MNLSEMIKNGYGKKEDLSCSERILYGANTVYNLGLDKDALIMAAGLSGGMYVGDVCGAVSVGVLVLSKLFVKDRAHESDYIKKLVSEFIESYDRDMTTYKCTRLKELYKTKERSCDDIILKAAELLDMIIERETNKNI